MTNGILLTRHNQEIAQWSPDPFPRERVGSGNETSVGRGCEGGGRWRGVCVGRGDILYNPFSFRGWLWHRTASPGGMPESPKMVARSPAPPPPPALFLSAFLSAPLSFFLSLRPGMLRDPRRGGERRGGERRGGERRGGERRRGEERRGGEGRGGERGGEEGRGEERGKEEERRGEEAEREGRGEEGRGEERKRKRLDV